ncbi:hypothetical protein [Terribacillus halophilus]|uniref:hypothetical protein n=1 Tax=Terribacillus halophilus TaxID=361279 RepID=UPI000984551F|nr:hypothetical protein [Terribacillus halophilus]
MDLNILISTIVTATSALVAIIGGFLVSRVITLAGEKNAIVRRLHELDNDMTAKERILSEIEIELLEEDVDDFIYEHCEELIIERKPIEEIFEGDSSISLSLEKVRPYIDELLSIGDYIIKLIDESKTFPEEFDDFLKENNIKIDRRRDWHKLVYQTIWAEIPKTSDNPFGINFPPPSINAELLFRSNPVNQQIYRDKIKQLNNLENELTILKLRREEQTKILNDYGKPTGLWGGLWVLIYACIVGIAYPSTLLPYPQNTYNDGITKWFLISLFISQLLALFLYLGISMSKLTKQETYK